MQLELARLQLALGCCPSLLGTIFSISYRPHPTFFPSEDFEGEAVSNNDAHVHAHTPPRTPTSVRVIPVE